MCDFCLETPNTPAVNLVPVDHKHPERFLPADCIVPDRTLTLLRHGPDRILVIGGPDPYLQDLA